MQMAMKKDKFGSLAQSDNPLNIEPWLQIEVTNNINAPLSHLQFTCPNNFEDNLKTNKLRRGCFFRCLRVAIN